MENTVDTKMAFKSAKKDFMMASACSIALIALFMILQGIGVAIANSLGIMNESYTQYILVLIPLHIITTPIIYFAFRSKKDSGIEKKKLTVPQFLGIIPIIYAFVFAGSMISNGISLFLNEHSSEAVAAVTTGENVFFRILVVGITAPIIEELLFRKLLIDRLAKHSQIWAVVFSAIAFGLFHMNITQFFYATFIGLVFGFVYVKTGNIFYTIGLHMVVNLATTCIAANITSEIGMLIYSAVLMSLAVLGVVLFFVKYRKALKLKKNENLSTGKATSACLLNPVTIIYFIVAFVVIVLNTIAMTIPQ